MLIKSLIGNRSSVGIYVDKNLYNIQSTGSLFIWFGLVKSANTLVLSFFQWFVTFFIVLYTRT